MIRSKTPADEARCVYSSGKEFAYDYVHALYEVKVQKRH